MFVVVNNGAVINICMMIKLRVYFIMDVLFHYPVPHLCDCGDGGGVMM